MTTLEYASARVSALRLRLRPTALLLTLLALPFVLAGALYAAAEVGVRFIVASAQTGYADVRDRYPRAG